VEADIRRIGPDDLAVLAVEVERARAAGEFRASAYPAGAQFLDSFRYAPAPAAAAFAADGSVVGFVSPDFKLIAVRPEARRRGIGTLLADAAVEMERERGRPSVLMGTLPGDAVGEAFMRATGFNHHSTVWDLELPLGVIVPAPDWPDGVSPLPFSRELHLRVWAELHNAAFADHPTPMVIDLTALETSPADPSVHDLDTILAVDAATGEMIGFCSTFADRHDGRPGPEAELWAIGVAPDRQGQGIGRQLLRWGVGHLRSVGVSDVRLSVNSGNEGALGLYRREGFVPWRTRERWARAVDPQNQAGVRTQ
jgi:mycothiol synthase